MLDFERLEVYKKAQKLNKDVFVFLKGHKFIDYHLQDQLKRASTSIILNIAEGTGRLSLADKRHFYTISRGSASEVLAVIEIINNQYSIQVGYTEKLRPQIIEISKMLFGLIKNTTPKKQ